MNLDLFINGEFRETEKRHPVIDPARGEVITDVGVASEKEIELAISSARRAFDDGEWPKIPLAKRKDFLLRIAEEIRNNSGELAKLETLNTGKPIKESTFMDIPSAANTFAYFAENLESFLQKEERELEEAKGILSPEPLGVCLLIVPWNYPLLIASWKLAQALACGNTVILKPSSLTPLTVLELARIIQKIGLSKGVVNIIVGRGEEIGDRLCSDKRIDMISFTGSNAVGKKILEYCRQNVKKIVFELGGKSASIILKDADLESAVNGSLCSIFLNQGQMCTAMSRIFVEEDVFKKFLDDFLAKARKIKLGNPLHYETQMGPLISQEQQDKVMGFVEEAKREGAKLVWGGKIPQDLELKSGFFFEPTIFVEVSPEMRIFQEEVFGPVVCIDKFSDLDQVIKLANATDFALASSIWTKDSEKAAFLANKINSGIVWINTYGMFYNEVPYGGFKQSGFGKELGREGFLEYTRLKSVIIDKTKGEKPLVSYWYGF